MHWYREKLIDDGNGDGKTWLDCETCQRMSGRAVRVRIACGYATEAEIAKAGGRAVQIDGAPIVSTCPGYTATLPEVLEAGRALGWSDRGLLGEFAPEPGALLLDLIDIIDGERRSVERHAIRASKEERR